jgi:hypothetical protein
MSPNSPNPNGTIATGGYQRITDGTNTVETATSTPTSTQAGLVVRQAPDIVGNTQIVAKTKETALFSQITDGTNNVAITAASSSPTGTAPALVVTHSPNSPELTSLAPSVVGSRAVVSAARYVATAPVLTDLQQNSMRLDNRGALVVSQEKVTVVAGQINPTADTALAAGKKLYRLAMTNNSPSVIYLQLHQNTAALATGAVPLLGFVFRVPANSSFILDETYFGDSGELISANTRIGLSTIFGTYNALAAGTLAALSLQVKLEA